MIVIAHFVVITCYIAAAALAALPFARRVSAPVNGVIGALVIGLSAHAFALFSFARESDDFAIALPPRKCTKSNAIQS